MKDETYYVNKCDALNKIKVEHTVFGKKETHQIEDKKVELTFNTYANGGDDYDDELVDVKII